MERKKSSGKPFQMRSGNSTPYPFLGKALKTIGGGIKNMLPGSKGNSGGTGSADDVNTKIDEIHAALVGDEGDTMMTKQTPMYHTVDAHGEKHGHKEPGYPTSYTEKVTEGPFPEKKNNK